MKDTLLKKLQSLKQRHDDLSKQLSDSAVIADQEKFTQYSKEYAELDPIVRVFNAYLQTQQGIRTAKELQADKDKSIAELAAEELAGLTSELEDIEVELKRLLLPTDPNDERNVYLEIRAGAGGSEAAIFAGDLFRMYSRYAEQQRWRVEVMAESEGEHGGYKEIISRVVGNNVYAQLKFESGAHRVQRVPETESQGRIHTSTCTVAVLPEIEEVEAEEINPSELRVDTYRASGAGGQHVNVTDSAVRLTHIPTGIVVECQDERSQHKNRARAMSLLQAKIVDQQRSQQEQERAEHRRSLVGTGDRSERIRTYNFPQGRVTDHRIQLTLYKLDEVLQGQLSHIIEPLIKEHQADLMAASEGS